MKRLLRGLQPYRLRVILVLLLTFGNGLGELFLPRLMSEVVDQGVARSDVETIYRIGAVMLGVVLVTVACRAAAAYHSAKAAMSFSRDLRHELFTKINHMTFDETEFFGIGSLITRTTDDVNQVEQMTLMGLRPMVRAPLMFIGGMMMALYTNARLSLVVLVSIPFLLLGLWGIIRLALPYFPKLQESLDQLNLLFRQRLTGLKVVRAFWRDDHEEAILSEANDRYYRIALKINQILVSIRPAMMIILNLTLVGIVYFGARLINVGDLKIGELMAYLQYIGQVLMAIMMMSNLVGMVPRSMTSAQRINEVLDYPTREVGGDQRLEGPVASLAVKDLTFYYPGANRPALSGINFQLSRGQTLGIIGGTGSGKSTLLKLLLHFYEASEGDIYLNGQPLSQLDTASVRDQLSYVPQQNFFFTKTVRDNLAYGSHEPTDEDLLRNLSLAHSRDFLDDQAPLEEQIHRGGSNFSGGQRQRLAIARSLSRPASVYLFDDSFSALDYQTDYEIRRGLGEALDEAIVIIVAQRVATIRHADQILVLDDGRQVGYGSHDELLEHCSLYREIALSQGEEVNHANTDTDTD